MKNAYAEKMRKMQREYTLCGVQLGLLAVTIALNREFGFGRKRLDVLQDAANDILNKVFAEDSPEYAIAQLREGCEQIMGEAFDE